MFSFDPDCFCSCCVDERAACQAFQNFTLERVGKAFLAAVYRDDDDDAEYFFNLAAEALHRWPLIPVRQQ